MESQHLKAKVAEAFKTYLKPFQKMWLLDKSRRKTWLKARQIGATDIGQALDAVMEALEFPHDQYVLSYRLDGAKEVLRDCIKWLDLFNDIGIKTPYKATKTVIEIHTGKGVSRIIALPGTPEAARSRRGTIRIDEVAFIRQSEEIYSAVGPLLSSNPRFRMILTSTPFGESGLFYRTHTDMEGWSKHRTDIEQAIADGLPRDINDLRKNSFNFEREFMCMFSAGGKYFGMDFLLLALIDEYAEAPFTEAPYGKVLGVDLAKIHDLTEIVEVTEAPKPYVSGHWIIKSLNYREQRRIIKQLADEREAATVVVDETKHPGTVDELRHDIRDKDGNTRVWGRVMTNKWKARAFPELRDALEADEIGIDYDCSLIWNKEKQGWDKAPGRPLLDQLLQVEQTFTAGGLVKYEVKRTKKDGDDQGHGDGAVALVLAHDGIKHAATEHPLRRAGRVKKARKKAQKSNLITRPEHKRKTRRKIIF